MLGGELLSAYVDKDSFSAFRSVDINMYGSNGYQLIIYNSGKPLANTEVNLRLTYIRQ